MRPETARRPHGADPVPPTRMPTTATRLIALLGRPVAHSLSPTIHAVGIREHRLDLVYLACPVAPEGLRDAVAGLWALGAVGANVTVPHKESVARLVARQSAVVNATGAANTLVREPEGWRAENTDVEGFLAPLNDQELHGASAVVLGAGGAARAVVVALASCRAHVTVVARRAEQAEALAHSMAAIGRVTARDWHDAGEVVRAASLVVNATPVGTNDPDATPWPDASAFHSAQTVYDLVYRPAETRLMHDARAAGARVVGGLPMLVAQAAASFKLWTGRDLPLDPAREAAEQALAR